jgi:hypothetical protein
MNPNVPKQGFVKLYDIIMEVLADEQRTTLHKFIWYLNYAIRGYNRLMMDVDGMAKTVCLPLEPSKVVPYPADMIGWLLLGVKVGDRIVAAIPDNRIHREKGDERYVPRQASLRFVNYYDQLEGYRRRDLWGLLHADNLVGFFKDNKDKKRFEFSADFRDDKVYLTYIGNCIDPDTETEVPVGAVDYLKAWIRYSDNRYVKGDADMETEARRISHLREDATYRTRISDLSADGILNALQSKTTMSTKY